MLSLLVLALLTLLSPSAWAQSAHVECLVGCAAGGDSSADVWLLTKEGAPVTLRLECPICHKESMVRDIPPSELPPHLRQS